MPSSAPPVYSPLSLHDALPISALRRAREPRVRGRRPAADGRPDRGLPDRAQRCSRGLGRRRRLDRRARRGAPALRDREQHEGHGRSEEHTSELQSLRHLVCRLLPHPCTPPFPYTTLFRSQRCVVRANRAYEGAGLQLTGGRIEDCRIERNDAAEGSGGGAVSIVGRGVVLLRCAIVNNTKGTADRKSTRLNSSHLGISYAVFCPTRVLPPFPTRRSSDLSAASCARTARTRAPACS